MESLPADWYDVAASPDQRALASNEINDGSLSCSLHAVGFYEDLTVYNNQKLYQIQL